MNLLYKIKGYHTHASNEFKTCKGNWILYFIVEKASYAKAKKILKKTNKNEKPTFSLSHAIMSPKDTCKIVKLRKKIQFSYETVDLLMRNIAFQI